MTRFRQALLEELLARVDERPALTPAGRATRRLRLAIAGAGVAALTGVAVLALAPSATPAYAVTTHSDGTVSIIVNNVGDPAEANRILLEAGVRATVMLPKTPADCPAEDRSTVTVLSFGQSTFTTDLAPAPEMVDVVDSTSHANEVRIHPNKIPAGQMLILAPVATPAGPMIQVATSVEPGPKCITNLTDSWWTNPAPTDPAAPRPTNSVGLPLPTHPASTTSSR